MYYVVCNTNTKSLILVTLHYVLPRPPSYATGANTKHNEGSTKDDVKVITLTTLPGGNNLTLIINFLETCSLNYLLSVYTNENNFQGSHV